MDRRTYLASVGIGMAALAGCSAAEGVLESKEYEQGDKESLLPDSPGSDWPDDNMEANHDLNENFDRVWTTPDESIAVMMDVEIHESIDGAEQAFERSKATASSPNDYPLADDAIIFDDGESARCVFRDSNAVGMTLAARQSGMEVKPDRTRATSYAEAMYSQWSDNSD